MACIALRSTTYQVTISLYTALVSHVKGNFKHISRYVYGKGDRL